MSEHRLPKPAPDPQAEAEAQVVDHLKVVEMIMREEADFMTMLRLTARTSAPKTIVEAEELLLRMCVIGAVWQQSRQQRGG